MKVTLTISCSIFLFYSLQGLVTAAAADCPTTWTCSSISNDDAPTLDGDLSDWDDENIPSFTTSLVKITNEVYMDGMETTYKCVHDDTRIYLAISIPGLYNFSDTDNHHCAALGTMMKIGADATYVNMGGCPDAFSGCNDDGTIPDTCEPYLVDIGVHWELATAQQGQFYDMDTTSGTGNDPIANKDDEYAVSPYCRNDDDDSNAGSEWSGAWKHTDPVVGTLGDYIFELSRPLQTASSMTDAQMQVDETYGFGVAFWDPFESVDGWTDSGHYITGCASDWIELKLSTISDTNGNTDTTNNGNTNTDNTNNTDEMNKKDDTTSNSTTKYYTVVWTNVFVSFLLFAQLGVVVTL